MPELITEYDIIWLEKQVKMQTDSNYHDLAIMDLKIAKAVRELQHA